MRDETSSMRRPIRSAALDMSGAEFRALGHELVDRIGELLDSMPDRPVTRAESAADIRSLIGTAGLPEQGTDAGRLLSEVVPLIIEHSVYNGHPRFLAYITSSPAPIGALADLLAASVNPNLGLWETSPVASEIEAQTVRWLAELIGYPSSCGGIMVSGGNAANFLAFVAARKAIAPWNIREKGLCADNRRLRVYASRATHTWIQKAADVCGIGTEAIRWIDTDGSERLSIASLDARIEEDRRKGDVPFMVVGTAGTVSTGSIDPLPEIAAICKEQQIWMHVDGAYGAPAAALPESPAELRALALADSVAIDPHKWLYSPIEAACVLTRKPRALPEAFSFSPSYYRHEEDDTSKNDYYEFGMQNTRGFRALKVWLGLRSAGRAGVCEAIRADMALAAQLYDAVDQHEELEAHTLNLSIATFRYVPADLRNAASIADAYLNELNRALVGEIQQGGELFLSNAMVGDCYLLRACVVNFRTTDADIQSVPNMVVEAGRKLDREMRPAAGTN